MSRIDCTTEAAAQIKWEDEEMVVKLFDLEDPYHTPRIPTLWNIVKLQPIWLCLNPEDPLPHPISPELWNIGNMMEHDAHDDQRDLNQHFRLPNSWNDQFLTTSISQYLVATHRNSSHQAVTVFPPSPRLGCYLPKLHGWHGKWTSNGFLLCSALTMQRLEECVYLCVYIYIYINM